MQGYYGKPAWDVILAGIASADEKWLSVYALLRPAGDGAAGEDLGQAVFDAFPVAPFKVIGLMATEGVSMEGACTMTFESGFPAEGINAYLTRLEFSLQKGISAEQRAIAEECEKGIALTRSAFMKSPDY